MNTKFAGPRQFRALFLIGSLISSLAWSAATDLADIPMAVKNSAPPNILFVTDDSASMASEVLLPTNDGALWWNTNDRRFVGRDANDLDVYATTPSVINFNKVGDSSGTWKKYVYLFPNGTGTGDRVNGDAANDHYAIPPTAAYAWVRSSNYNPLYYNPMVTYNPWAPYYNGTTTVTLPSASSTAAKSHPILGATTINLTSNVNVNTANWTFRMWPGMTAPNGSSYRKSGASVYTLLTTDTVVPAGDTFWDVQISYYPATYYVGNSSASNTYVGPDGAHLTRYEIKPGNTFPSGRTYAAEMQNFANWFTYYRKRQLMLNGSMGSVLDGLDGVRGGIIRFNNLTAATMYDFTQTSDALNERALLNSFYNIAPGGGTPTRDALDYAGQQFMRTGTGAPVQYSCQFNIGFVLTDGFAQNTSNVSISPSNYDGQTDYTAYPYNRQYKAPVNGVIPTVTYPYQDTFGGTIADIAMKYYSTNLRLDLTAGNVPVNTDDTGPDADRNPNLHMNTYALGLGVKGFVFGTGSAAALNPYTTAPVWPDPNAANRSPAGVDDLWHAALNGRGEMFTATDPVSVKRSLDTVINSVVGKAGSAAAVTVSNPNIVVGGVNASYNSSYNSGNWTGNLAAYTINATTGAVDTSNPKWSSNAQAQLDVQTQGVYSDTARKIASYSGTGQSSATGSGGIQFQPSTSAAATKLTAAQQAVFNSPATPPGPSDSAAVIAYLRGDRSGDGVAYRNRAHVLGDIINAETVIVQKPAANYLDDCYATAITGQCAQSFKESQASRASMLFQPANDGMVHAFNAATGAEDWAYIPKIIWPNLVNLTKRSGFSHQYYIDATPVVSDVDFKNTDGGSGNPDWHTMLVGGFGKGGRGYYALDVTNPSATSEADAAAKVLWEFPNSVTSDSDNANMGYSFGRPLLVKTAAEGWVVIVASGYNNTTVVGSSTGTGHGYLYVLNPRNGAVIKRIDTGVGSTTTPAGLAKLSGFVDNGDIDNTVTYVYGGDLLGNVWRFDFTGSNSSSWSVTKLATLVDSSGIAQSVTTEPELATATLSGTDYQFVYVGTGRYLGDSDVATSQIQTMYGLIDDLSNNPEITIGAGRTGLQQQTMSSTSATRRSVTANAANYASGGKHGWYLDLSLSPGERIVADPQLAVGVLAFTTNIPSATACVPGGASWFYTIDYATGGLVSNSTLGYSGISLGNALASRVTLVKLPDGSIKAIIRLSDTTTIVLPTPQPASATSGRRVSWRELLTN